MCNRRWTNRQHRSSVADSAISRRRISNPHDCCGQSCISPTLLPLLSSHGELCHFIVTIFESSMLACTSVHRPDDDFLLSFPFFLDGIHKFLGRPIRKSVAVCNFSAEVKSSKGGHITSGVVFVVPSDGVFTRRHTAECAFCTVFYSVSCFSTMLPWGGEGGGQEQLFLRVMFSAFVHLHWFLQCFSLFRTFFLCTICIFHWFLQCFQAS